MILDEVALVCLVALAEIVSAYGGHLPPGHDDKAAVCLEVGRAADELELPVALAVSVALEESRFTRQLKSKAGAMGPLQIIPRYHCPDAMGQHKPHARAGGEKIYASSRAYARRIMRRAHRLDEQVSAIMAAHAEAR